MARPPAAKKQTLTFKQLANYDDILTDALVDHVYYWTRIPKNRAAYHPSRGIREDEITKVIQTEAIVNQDVDAAESGLLATDGLRKFHASLRTPPEQADFRRHLRRYIQIYLPDCPWEVNSTNRYTIVSHEASVTARRYIRRNETIRYLAGISVVISPQEERELADKKRNFSIVVSSRNRTMSLFMGPARFANHDCRANAKLMTTLHSGIEVVATQDIDVGEEITVTYGDHYFGEYNCDCLCQTCEKARVNGWAPSGETGPGVVTGNMGGGEDESLPGYALRRRRREDSTADSSRTPSVAPDMRPRIPKTRPKSTNAACTNAACRDSLETLVSPYPDALNPSVKRSADAITPPITPAKRARTRLNESYVADLGESATSSDASERATSISSQGTGDGALTDATSPPESGVGKPSPEPELLSHTSALGVLPTVFKEEDMEEARAHCLANAIPFVPITSHVTVASTPKLEDTATPIPLQQMSNATAMGQAQPQVLVSVEARDEPADDAAATTRRKYQRRVYNKATTPPVSRARAPGDYTLTPLLLSQSEMAWIYCTICNTAFVQVDAYFTRSACPRCERHSKLYGYVWPKTEKASPNDKEDRVLDHRTVHRFLDAEDEARIRGRKRPAWARNTDDGEERDDGRENLDQDGRLGGAGVRRGRGRPRLIPEALKSMQARADEDGASEPRRSGRSRRLSARAASSFSL